MSTRSGDPDDPADADGEPGSVVAGGEAGEPGPRAPRPFVERLGMALIALVIAAMFGGMAVASWAGGEGFLAVMAATGALMTAWAGAMTLRRG